MIRNIILSHIRFLEIFKWFNNQGILTTKHKTPIQYSTINKANNAFKRVMRKGIKLLLEKYGLKCNFQGNYVNITISTSQFDQWFEQFNNIDLLRMTLRYHFTNSAYSGHKPYYRNLNFASINIPSSIHTYKGTYLTNYLDDILKDLEQIAKIINPEKKPLKKAVRKTKTEVKTTSNEQELFDASLARRL